MDLIQITKATVGHLTPEIVLLIGGTLIMCASVLTRKSEREDLHVERSNYAFVSLICLLVAMATRYWQGVPTVIQTDLGAFRFDASALAAERLTFLGGLILILMSWSTAPKGRLAEYYGCLLIILAAIPIVGASNDLVTMFLGLELVSIPTYILLGIVKTDNSGAEASLKYFLLSAFASCFFLLGVSYLYGFCGSTNLAVIQASFGEGKRLMALGLLLAICGLSFRITAVPFHFYAPDVFEGTSVTMAGAMSYLPKVAGFVAFRWIDPADMGLWVVVQSFQVWSDVFRFGIPNGLTRQISFHLGRDDRAAAESTVAAAELATRWSMGARSWPRMSSTILGAARPAKGATSTACARWSRRRERPVSSWWPRRAMQALAVPPSTRRSGCTTQ